jgi:hypothetical protein
MILRNLIGGERLSLAAPAAELNASAEQGTAVAERSEFTPCATFANLGACVSSGAKQIPHPLPRRMVIKNGDAFEP